MKRVCFCLLALLFLVGCSKDVHTQYYLMDTVMSFEIYGESAADAEQEIADKIATLETLFSPTRAESELSRVNAGAGTSVEMSEEFARLLTLSLKANEETNGAFDPTLGAAINLWKKETVPTPEALSELTVGCENVHINGTDVQLQNGLKLDFGAVAKGYASDCAKEILERYHIPNALLSLGGNVYAKGGKKDGSPWLVGVRDPNGAQNDWLGILGVRDRFLVASGDYERFFEQDGVRYHHILDPTTLAPAKSDLREVVVVCDNGTRADILSTALFVMGYETAVDCWKEHRDFELVLVKDGTVSITSNLAEEFTLTNPAYRLEVIE
ncbi:MAG: FAD:protein FMN transferase [Oscillospiraceae bacterium]|nr:FAD:protein FMN transferase [Oscillospiraceae bacterium]